jgi:DNA-binding transcriptional MerR regulator
MKIYYGEADIAHELGVKPQTIQVYRRRGTFPEPDAQTVAGRPLWEKSTIKTWLKNRGS